MRRLKTNTSLQPQEEFSSSLEDNLELFKKYMGKDGQLKVRYVTNAISPHARFNVLFLDGMASTTLIGETVVEPLLLTGSFKNVMPTGELICTGVVKAAECRVQPSFSETLLALLSGDTIVLAEGCSQAVVVGSKGYIKRATQEPGSETINRGPREGFTEVLLDNAAMLRRKLRTSQLKFVARTAGERTNTRLFICYIEGIAKQDIVDEFIRRIDNCSLDGYLEVNYFAEQIRDAKHSPFLTLGVTERPDVLAAKLLEGRVTLMLDGSPVALTAPNLLIEDFQASDDYYLNYNFSSISRVLRIASFLITILTLPIYIAAISYQQQSIPVKLFCSIASASNGTPFNSVTELVIMMVIFEILRETSARVPSNTAQTLSIVGALVVGQAAVEAKIVSAPTLIIVAMTGITALINNSLKGAIIVVRCMLIVLAATLGMYGVLLGTTGLLIHLCSIKSFSIPYLEGFASFRSQKSKDILVRRSWRSMVMRPEALSQDKKRKEAPDAKA